MSQIKNIKYEHLNWGPYVMRVNIPKNIIDKLKKEGKKLKPKDSYNKNLAGHLNHQYKYPVEIQNWFYRATTPYWDAYRQGHCEFHGIKNLRLELGADDLWVNFMKPGDFNPMHTHGGDYSFVLFLDVPKQLTEEQENFEGTSHAPGTLQFEFTQQAKPRYATTGHNARPKTGEMYIFPALLQHWVCPFKSKVTRISVSGNLRIENRDKLPYDYF